MNEAKLKGLSEQEFQRATGFSRATFKAMVEELKPHLERRGKRGGQNRLSVENQLLVTVQYWREYRSQFHIGLEFGVSEATVCRIIAKVENILVKSGRFALPGKKSLLKPKGEVGVVVVDVTEVSIERPQKNSVCTTVARSGSTPSKLRSLLIG